MAARGIVRDVDSGDYSPLSSEPIQGGAMGGDAFARSGGAHQPAACADGAVVVAGTSNARGWVVGASVGGAGLAGGAVAVKRVANRNGGIA
jgi:hypothetical protein